MPHAGVAADVGFFAERTPHQRAIERFQHVRNLLQFAVGIPREDRPVIVLAEFGLNGAGQVDDLVAERDGSLLKFFLCAQHLVALSVCVS